MLLSLIQTLLIPALGFAAGQSNLVCTSTQTGMIYNMSSERGHAELMSSGKLGLECSERKQAGVAAEIAKINKDQAACHRRVVAEVEVYQCESAALDNVEKILERESTKIKKSLTLNSSEKKNMEAYRHLVSAQRTWVSFRDASCTLKASGIRRGSGEDLVLLRCLSAMTKSRILELDAIFNSDR